MKPWYDQVENSISIETIPSEYRNGNAKIFEDGFKKNGYQCAPLQRAQKNCRYSDGNDCIECLAGCRIQSKQSTPWTVLAQAKATGMLTLVSEFEVNQINETPQGVSVSGITSGGLHRTFLGKKIVLASGSIGNTKILLLSGYQSQLPALGHDFFTHPQFMHLYLCEQTIGAQRTVSSF